jgi:hypothetical protein
MAKLAAVAKKYGGLIGAAFGIAAVAGVKRMVSTFVETTDQVSKFSQRIGVSTQFLSELGFVADKTGVVVSQMQIGFQRATRRVSEFVQTGAGPAADVLADLEARGVRLTNPGGGLKSIEDLLPDLADYFRDLGDDTLKVRKAFQLFDSEGVSLVNILNLGADGLKAMREEAVKYGVSLDENMIEKAVEVKDATVNMNASLTGLKNELVLGVAPAFATAAQNAADFIAALRNADWKGINEGIGDLARIMEVIANPATVLLSDKKEEAPNGPKKFNLYARLERASESGGEGPAGLTRKKRAQEAWDRAFLEREGKVGLLPSADFMGEVDKQIEAVELVEEAVKTSTENMALNVELVNIPFNRLSENISGLIAPLQQSKTFAVQVFGDIASAILKATTQALAFRAAVAIIPGFGSLAGGGLYGGPFRGTRG